MTFLKRLWWRLLGLCPKCGRRLVEVWDFSWNSGLVTARRACACGWEK